METNDCCAVRQIGESGIKTPLLVPSFSSTAYPRTSDLRDAISEVKSHIAISSLISAYDIHCDYVDKEVALSDLVIVDSGNYEKRVLEGLGCQVGWTHSDYASAIDSIVPLTQVALVNYDEPGPLAKQVESARSTFEKHPKYLTDFLCKPISNESPYVDLDAIEEGSVMLRGFDILGITEKELGSSLTERCENLVRLRRLLVSKGFDVPIHVFGCFEPSAVALMCLCGADIFDGLTWTRYSNWQDILVYTGSVPFITRKWSMDDYDIQRASETQNLSLMTELMFRLRSFGGSHDYFELGLKDEITSLAKSIMAQTTKETK